MYLRTIKNNKKKRQECLATIRLYGINKLDLRNDLLLYGKKFF